MSIVVDSGKIVDVQKRYITPNNSDKVDWLDTQISFRAIEVEFFQD